MSLRYWFRGPDQDLVEITGNMRKYTLDFEEKAEEGSTAVNRVIIDDPDATLDGLGLKGHRIFAIEETAAVASNFRFVGIGYIGSCDIIRGPYRTGVGRQWSCEVADLNTVLNRRVMVGTGNKRPAETDVARIQWVESTHEGELIDDTRYLSTLNPVNMDANDYLLQDALAVYNDAAQQSGKNYFLTHFGDVGVDDRNPWGYFSLWYDFAAGSNYQSTARLSNVAADVDMTTTFPIYVDDENKLTIDPMRIVSTVVVPYKGSYVTASSDATRTAYARLDKVMQAENVSTRTTASARANRYIRDLDTPDYRATVRTIVPRAYVNLIRPGMAVQVKATHWVEPFASTYTYMRVLSRRVVEVSEDDDQTYELLMELSYSEVAAAAGSTHARLYHPHGPYSGLVEFGGDGDDPPPGKVMDPTTGLVTTNTGGIWGWTGLTFGGAGTISLKYEMSLAGVRSRAKGYTILATALLDGVTVASASLAVTSDGTGLTSWGDRILLEDTVAVTNGSVMTFTLSCTPGMAFFRTPKGVDSGWSGVQVDGALA